MAKPITLNICHLYPDLMDTYGDFGNIIAIKKRCEWRQITVKITSISVGDEIKNKDIDLIFFGGGQDNVQKLVSKDLESKAETIKNFAEKNTVILSICGGYQLLQKYFKTHKGEMIKGIDLFDAYTEASNDRMIQNLLIETDDGLQQEIESSYPSKNLPSRYLIGFENHSGKTFLGKRVKPLGSVIAGSGNNGNDQTEGAIYKNSFGCYLHGSLLPKNPHFTDFLISKALENKGIDPNLNPLDDTTEWQAHNQALEKTRSTS